MIFFISFHINISANTDFNGLHFSLFLIDIIGQKYECAKRWNVHCVTMQWFFDSVEKGFCQDESIYKAEPRSEAKSMPDTSTPTGQINTIDSKFLWD